jgi:hypothetical protein
MALVAVAGFGLYRRRQLNRMAPPFQGPSAAVLSVSTTSPPPLGAELQVRNEAGQIILQTREVARLPIEARRVGTDPVAIQRGQQLAADLFKGVSTLPGKTIEVVFDPKILQGLQGGVLEVMPAAKGGTYAIARNVETGRTAGQGRLIQGGGARQLAAGLFHLASIAIWPISTAILRISKAWQAISSVT